MQLAKIGLGRTGASMVRRLLKKGWRRSSVIGSCLLNLIATALLAAPKLAACGGRMSDSGEGRWTIAAAIDEGVSTRALLAMRHTFGGHLEMPAEGST